ncbi:MAG: PDZ domain-containing protein [Lentisphaerae bacterium]|nr:PDZ domain-containing protein [Lentisphaerota bacterium]MBT7843976.1 PDZ domain-containing protein [Lentisphaerota bacterium]
MAFCPLKLTALGPGGEGEQAKPSPTPVGSGSGIIVRADGYVLTNYHVVQESDALEVRLSDGRTFDSEEHEGSVEIVGYDEQTDLAVLKIGNGKIKDLPILPFADSDKVKPGQWAIAVGAPYNLDHSVTVGVVSYRGRHDMRMTSYENYIQTDASINPGNSGGPLLNIRGEVMGVNEFIVTGGGMSRGSVGIGFAIASNLAKQVSDNLVEFGEVRRPFLGIGMQELSEDLKRQFGVERGVVVSEVMEGDPADKAGIKPWDVVLKVGNKEVGSPHDMLFALLHQYKPGDEVKLVIDRQGKRKEFTVVARLRDDGGDRIPRQEKSRKDDTLNDLGLILEETDKGIVVTGISPGSPASRQDLRRGDLILEVNRQRMKKIRDMDQALAGTKNDMAVLYVERRGSKFFVPIRTGDGGK